MKNGENSNLIKILLIDYTENKKITFFRYLVVGGFVTVINILLLYILQNYYKTQNYCLADVPKYLHDNT